MNLRPHRRPHPDINLTPLIDVVFLLLIFFMVSTTFKDEARLRVQLPQAQGEEVPAEEPEQIRILIDQSGSYFVDDRAVVDRNPITLVRALNGALAERPDERRDLPVLIQADAQTPHQAVMTAMDAASEVGLRRIAFAATRGAEASREPEDTSTPEAAP
ncbi:MAG: ExbD/TolR family protein [Bdellovibrio bacteriovorus]